MSTLQLIATFPFHGRHRAVVVAVVAAILIVPLFGFAFVWHPQAAGPVSHGVMSEHRSVPASPSPGPVLQLELFHGPIALSDISTTLRGAPDVPAVAGILIDPDTGVILWEKNPHLALPPASTTKVMTSLVALENFSAQLLIPITPVALNEAPDETVMGLRDGDIMTLKELLYGMLLPSGNDAANAIAADTVGMDVFVNTMNQQEAALGLSDSHFVSPVGLDDPGQRMSAYDLAAITMVDVKNFALFRQIVATQSIVLPANGKHGEFDLTNANRLLQLYQGAVGVKTGYTQGAGYCLVGMAQRNGHHLIAVLLNATLPAAHEEELFDWGFAHDR